jgi:Phospholipase_D-nuclease N-terminal
LRAKSERRQRTLAEVPLGDVLWSMLVFFFWFMAIWVFIMVFADIFRRRGQSGWAKAGWVFLIFVLPFLSALIYLIARPTMTEQDREEIQKAQEAQRRLEGYSAADEIAKFTKLHEAGSITDEEYADLKQKAMLQV